VITDVRIALAGASGCGKTTLMDFLAQELGLPVNPVGSRSVALAMGFMNPYDVDAAGQRPAFQERLMRDKIAWEATAPSFVTDRTTADQLAYHAMHALDDLTGFVIDAAAEGMQRYTHVLYCPLAEHQSLAGDPARRAGRAYHEVYDALLYGLLHRFCGDAVVRVSGDDLARRKQFVLATVTGWLSPSAESRR
jgi:predicted ATPase